MGSTKLMSSKQMHTELLDGVKDLWKNSLFFDFTLKVEDEAIPVHKVVLAACSGYFRAMFNSSMKESSERSVELKGLTASAVKSVIKFIYTGDIELSEDSFEGVLSAAHYLQIHLAVSLCCDYLLDDMTWDSVCHVQHLAQMYALDYVERQVNDFMLTSFSEMPEEVAESVGKQILKLVVNKDLRVRSEYILFEKLLLFKTILSEDEFHAALSQVRFPLMTKDELEKVSSTGVITTILSHLMDEAWEYHKDVMRQPLLQTERTQVRSDNVAMIMADFHSINAIYLYQENKNIWMREPFDEELFQAGYHSIIQKIVTLDNYLYVSQHVGEPDYSEYSSFFRYDPRFNTWQGLSRFLHTERKWFSLVVCDKKFFAIGGNRTRTVEIYDIQSNKWQFCADINYDSVFSGGVALGGKIYISGGHFYPNENPPFGALDSFDTLSCYDPVSDTWQFKAPMVEPRSRHQSVACDGKIFVFAGERGRDNIIYNAEYYSPVANQWTLIHNSLPYDIDGVCSNGSDIYILKRNEHANAVNRDTMTVSFDRFMLETGNMEEEGFTIIVPKYDDGYLRFLGPFMCSTLMLPSN